MCVYTDPSAQSQAQPFTGRLLLAIVLVLLVSPQGLLAQEILSVEDLFTQANARPVEHGRVGLLGSGAYRVWRAPRNGTLCDFGQAAYGAYCEHPNGYAGYLGGGAYGVLGQHTGGNAGFLGGVVYGTYGQHINGNFGFLGHDDYGVLGFNANGNYGYLGNDVEGVFGQHSSGTYGGLGDVNYGAHGYHSSGNYGHIGGYQYGAYGFHFPSANYGALGSNLSGAYGQNGNTNRGYLGHQDYGVYGFGRPWAGYFDGSVRVTGIITEGAAAFKVDHPLDPENRYLSHSAVESPDMLNVYNGTVTTDAQGEAVVALPDYFEALNRDFRYQLTVIGTFAQAIVAEKIRDNRFVIRTDAPNVEVSWQVTGIRQDPWAEAHRIVVEEAKPAEERGYYLHPKLYGQPAERSVEWARDPEGMRALEEMPARLEAQRRRMEAERQRLDEARQRMQERPR